MRGGRSRRPPRIGACVGASCFGGGGLAEDVHVLMHDPRQPRLLATPPAAWLQLAVVDRDEQRDDVLPVGEPELGAERDCLAAEVAGGAFELAAAADGDEVAARPEHD